MATRISISRDTVEKACKRLKDAGYLESVPNLGYYVCEKPSDTVELNNVDTLKAFLQELKSIRKLLSALINE